MLKSCNNFPLSYHIPLNLVTTQKTYLCQLSNLEQNKNSQQGSATIYVLGCGLALFSPGLSIGLSLSSDYISWDAVSWNEEVVHYRRQKSI